MLELALTDQSGFRIDPLEAERAGPSYTADTLDELHRRHPAHEWYLLMGSDSLPDLPQWHEPHRIIHRAILVVMERPGWPVVTADELAELLKLSDATTLRVQKVDVPLIDLASRDIRRRVRHGTSIRFMVPAVVEEYVCEQKLYVGP